MLRLRRLPLVVLSGAALFSLDVLRASPRDQVATVVLLSFAGALHKFVLWSAAAVLVWRLIHHLPLDGRPVRRTLALHLLAGLGIPALVTVLAHVPQWGLRPALQAVLPAGSGPRLVGSWTGAGKTPLEAEMVMWFPWALLTYWAILAGLTVWQWEQRGREREREALQLVGQVSQARLHALETQLHPHFLFNALHTISSLLARDPEGARAVTRSLRGLLQRLLAPAQPPLQPLAEELDLLRHYVAIQQARFGPALIVEVEVDPACAGALVPSLLLQPLVENAVAHVAALRSGPTRIQVRAWRAGNQLELEVHDDGPGRPPAVPMPRPGAGTGIGLTNTRQRLWQIYGDRQRFHFQESAPPLGGALVRISLPVDSPTVTPDPQRPGPTDPRSAAAFSQPAPSWSPSPEPARPWLTGWLLFAGAMLVLNLVWSSARYLARAQPPGLGWGDAIAAGSRGAAALMLLFPLVYWVNRRVVARISHLVGRLAMHALLVLALSAAKSALVHASIALVDGGSAPPILALIAARIYADILHYALMVGLANALLRYQHHRVQALRAARLEAELTGARLRTLRLRLQPERLFATLDGLEALIGRAPEDADRAIARLGERLRRLLHGSQVPSNAQPEGPTA